VATGIRLQVFLETEPDLKKISYLDGPRSAVVGLF
jgi:hypothetical protein